MGDAVIIGLTGPTGAGKSALAAIAGKFDCRYVDCDILARRAVEPGMPALLQLSEAFGCDVVRPDGSLDRPLLAQRAFPTMQGREKLNAIVHPAVFDLLEDIIAECSRKGKAGVIVDAPLLFESALDRRCDRVIAVVAPDEYRLERIMKRDGLSEQAARMRMNAQHPCEYYSSQADYTIVNDSTLQRLYEQAEDVLRDILKGDVCEQPE